MVGQLGLQHLFQRLGEKLGKYLFFAEEIVDALRSAQFLPDFLDRWQRRLSLTFDFRFPLHGLAPFCLLSIDRFIPLGAFHLHG